MSRYELRTRTGRKVSIGWDRPLRSFFLQAAAVRGAKPQPEVWLGAETAEIPDIEALEAALAANGIDTAALLAGGIGIDWSTCRDRLANEQAKSPPPTPLQAAMASGAWRGAGR